MRSRRVARDRRGIALLLRHVLLLLLAAIPASAAAAEGTEPIRIAVSAPAGCPDTDAFVAEVTGRTAKARLATAGEPARSFTVTITANGKKAQGTLLIEDPKGAGGTRTVSGESCAEVASALALVTALSIDPKASTAARVAPPPPRPPPPPAPPPPPKPVELPRNPQPIPPYAPLPSWGPIGMPLPALPGQAPTPRWRFTAALHAGAASAIAPELTLLLSGSIEAARMGSGLLSPALRLSILKADSGDTSVGASPLLRARFLFVAGRIEGCPIRVDLIGPVTAYPCALFEAGSLDGSGRSPFVPGQTLPAAQRTGTTRPWIAPGLLGRFQIAAFGDLLLELEGGAVFPLIRDTFHFGPPPPAATAITVHQVPVAGGFVSAGVGMHFP